MRQDCTQEQKNPSEQAISDQVEVAATIWKDCGIESEDSLVPQSIRGQTSTATSSKDQSHQPTGRSAGKSTGKGKKGGRGGGRGSAAATAAQLLCFAAKQRAKTAKDFSETERLLQRALTVGEKIVKETAPRILTESEDPENDPSLALLKSRIELVKQALNATGGLEAKKECETLYQLAMKDPYLKDLHASLLSDPDAVQTIGALQYTRRVSLDLRHG